MTPEELHQWAESGCDCDDPHCGLIIRQKCHRDAGATVKYFKSPRTLQICCKACGGLTSEVDFAPQVSRSSILAC